MQQSAYFISDLHLDTKDTVNCAAFFHFLHHIAPQAKALYILGDLFDFWIGDDDLFTPLHQDIAYALSTLVEQGTAVFYMHGNRDFLVGMRFAQACKLTLLADPTLVTIAGKDILLSHGDLLCTQDKHYRTLRAIVHHPLIQRIFLALPKRWRRAIARYIQRKGRNATQSNVSPSMMDVTEEAVHDWMHHYQRAVLIHGHTHRSAKHVYPNGNTRWVLPDWAQGAGGYLYIDAQDITLLTL